MSKICENCGNMIPDGADVCPGCGRQQYDDDALKTVLSELSFALDEIQNEGSEVGADEGMELPQIEDVVLDEEAAESAGDDGAAKGSQVGAAIKLTQEDTPKQNNAKKASAKKKKKKKKKGGGSTIVAIIVGILIALLLVAGAAVFMLYRMGFFELLSDDQLLQTQTSTVEETIGTEELPSAPVVEEAPVAEASVVEESVVEEPAVEAPVAEEGQEDEVLTPELAEEESVEEDGVQVTKFNITGANSMTFTARGDTAEIVYVISPEDAQWDIVWESSDDTIATVNNAGVITARRGGSCTITGSCGGLEVSVEVICSFSVPSTVLDMNYSDITMDHEGQEVQMRIDYDLTDEQVAATVWESSDPAVATVNEEGLVTAVADGTVVISASIGDYTASCIVRCVNVTGNKGVNPDDSEYVINYEDVTLTRKGEYFQLSLKSILDNELPEFKWESSDSDVATVDSKGVVTAVADGTCKITTSVGEDDFECIVRVHITG